MSVSHKVTLPLTVQIPCGVHEWWKMVGDEKWNSTDWTGRTVITRYRKVKTQDFNVIIVKLLLSTYVVVFLL